MSMTKLPLQVTAVHGFTVEAAAIAEAWARACA
jgi:hypothetical protein